MHALPFHTNRWKLAEINRLKDIETEIILKKINTIQAFNNYAFSTEEGRKRRSRVLLNRYSVNVYIYRVLDHSWELGHRHTCENN